MLIFESIKCLPRKSGRHFSLFQLILRIVIGIAFFQRVVELSVKRADITKPSEPKKQDGAENGEENVRCVERGRKYVYRKSNEKDETDAADDKEYFAFLFKLSLQRAAHLGDFLDRKLSLFQSLSELRVEGGIVDGHCGFSPFGLLFSGAAEAAGLRARCR